MWMTETRKKLEKAFDHFAGTYATKYDKAVACLAKDRDKLLAVYNFPEEHRKHICNRAPSR